jgi:hypothetical protein
MSQDLPGQPIRTDPTLVGDVGELFIQPEPTEVCLDSGVEIGG